jgi:ABC-type transport system involved in cytochrome c biogenesis permease subunit
MPGMHTFYLWSAMIGGGLLVLQLLLTLVGGDSDVDGEVDGDVGADGVGLSFRTAVAFMTFFGLGGMMSLNAGLAPLLSLALACLAGAVAFWLVGLAMFQISRLRSSGNVDVANAVGAEGKVYLKVPAERAGEGRVTIPIQGRTMQFRAITRGPELPTGCLCRVVAVHAGDTLEIEPV